MKKKIKIAGAGLSGLTAGMLLAKEGREVEIHELTNSIGNRFGDDFQGLENWTKKNDVIAQFQSLGIPTDFDFFPTKELSVISPKGKIYSFSSRRNFYYLIKRGKQKGRLDSTFFEKAKKFGARVIFNSKLPSNEMDIDATGPKVTSAMAFGFTFQTDSKSRNFMILDNDLAPKGYAYCLTREGWGTVATAFYGNYQKGKTYLENTLKRFKEILGLPHEELHYFACRGSYFPTQTLKRNKTLLVGESGGLQDYLLGFGLRYAILSGYFAAQSILEGKDFDKLWKSEFQRPLNAGLVNRFTFEKFSNEDFERILPTIGSEESLHKFLTRVYNLGLATNFAFPIIKWKLKDRFTKFEQDLI